MNFGSITSILGVGLQSAGISTGGIRNTLSQKLDSIISSGGTEFFGFAGKAIERIDPSQLIQDRSGFSSNSNPTSDIANSKSSSGGSSFQYPPDLGDYFISFAFSKYQRPAPLSKAKSATEYTLTLPIPKDLHDDFAVSYTEKSLGIYGGAADNLTENWYNSSSKSIGSIVGGSLDTEAGSIYGALGKLTSDIAGDEVVDIAGQFIGAIPNPHFAQIFSGPRFRDYTFQWRFHPNNANESETLKKMIKEVKKRILPARSLNLASNVLDYPNIVLPNIKLGDEEMYSFKKGVITDLRINYAPGGTPSFFAGTKAPTLIDFGFRVLEIEYFLSEDFDDHFQARNPDLGSSSVVKSIKKGAKAVLQGVADATHLEKTNPIAIGKGSNAATNFFQNSADVGL